MDDIEKIIWIEGLKNAIKFKGKANPKAIMGKLMKERPALRSQGKSLNPKIAAIIAEVNALSLEAQEKKVLQMDPHALDKEERKIEEKKLPDLPDAVPGKVVMRLAPYPSGALHIGNARMIVLNDEYVKRYNGKLLLVFDDTIGTTLKKIKDPKAKYVIPEAYDLIPEGLDWLGVKYHETYYKSDRVEIYQTEAGKLIDQSHAYVCTCPAQEFRDKYKKPGKPCPCRGKDLEYHQEMYQQMKDGKIEEGGAVVRLKTGMDQRDPALRDHIIMRISDAPHPRIGTKVRLWPVLEFSWGLDDHLLGMTHIIRGIDLKKEGDVEKFIWDLYGWKHADITLYGRLKFPDDFRLSKTLARQRIQTGMYSNWSDPRIWSLQSLQERGIRPQAVREALLDLGLSKRGIEFSKDWVYSKNTKLIDDGADRYWFVENPLKLDISDLPFNNFTAKPLLNPNFPKKGTRAVSINITDGSASLYIAKDDKLEQKTDKGKVLYPAMKKGDILRIKDMFNIQLTKVGAAVAATFESQEKLKKVRKIQAIPSGSNIPIKILQPDGKITEGFGEINLRSLTPNSIVQFERYGYVCLKEISKNHIFGYFTNS